MLGPLIVGLATGEATSMVRRARRAVVAYLVAAVLACIGLVFLLLAAWIFLARRLGPIAEELAREAAARSEKRLAEVRTAVPLTDAQRRELESALTKVAGQPVELKVVVDPTVVGGVVARVGDEVFDGSVASRLADAKQHLTGSV